MNLGGVSRSSLVILVVLLVGLAGCTGVDGADNVDSVDVTPTVPDEDPDVASGTTSNADETDTAGGTNESDEAAGGELEVHHIDVGQADATLIITPAGETVLIDTGDWRPAGEATIAYMEALDIDRIDHLVATHPHADHIGGHAAVIEWAVTEGDGIGAAYDSGVPHTSATYERYLDAIEEYDVELFIVEEGDELPLQDDNISALVLNPPRGDAGDDLDANSVSIVFEYGEFRYLTTGDADADAEERMVDAWGDELDADVYQAGHHGSSTSSSQAFLEAVTPAIAVISSDFDSQYGHPHDEVLERFATSEIETYWTGVHGDIVVTTDGTDVTVETTEEFSTDAADLLEEKPSENTEESIMVSPGPIEASGALIAAS